MFLTKNISLLAVSVLLIGVFLSGCSIPKGLQTMSAVSSEEKEIMLRERLTKFNRAVYWGAGGEVTGFLVPELRAQFMNDEFKRRERERLVSSDVVSVTLDEQKDRALVEMKVKFYEQPRYVVQMRRETQDWRFERFSGGWLLEKRESEVIPEDTSPGSKIISNLAPLK